MVEGRRTPEATREAVLIATRQYAKRQRTWFRHQLGAAERVLRLDPTAPDAARQAERWFEEGETS
jgi:tRNA dimethylallyltransferase